MTNDPTLAAIQVGQPRVCGRADAADVFDRPWRSAIVKASVSEAPVFARRLGLDGDAQADTVHHGGVDKAICVYSIDHYPFWAAALGVDDLGVAPFGENFSVRGLTEADVCIGDVWDVGDARLQISQPRQPCWKLAHRWRRKDLALRVQRSGRTGWYFRVLTEGMVAVGQTLSLRARPHPAWTVAAANLVMHERQRDIAAAATLAALPGLSASWQHTLKRRVTEGRPADDRLRLGGAASD